MKSLIAGARKFFVQEEAATMVEYGILVALISVAAIVMINNVGGKVNTAFTTVNTKMTP